MIEYLCPKCGAKLQNICYTSYPAINAKKCFNCGWEVRSDIPRKIIQKVWEEGDPV